MNIWIVQTGEPLPMDQKGGRLWRSGLLAKTLHDRGHEVTWWASSFRHADHTFRYEREVCLDWEGIKLILVQSPGYSRNVSLGRLWDHHVLGKNMAKAINLYKPPDIIHCGYPTLETCEAMVNYGNTHKIPTMIDVRDMWPEAFADVVPKRIRPLAKHFFNYFSSRSQKMFSRATAISGHTIHFRDYGLSKARRRTGRFDKWFPFAYQSTPPDQDALAYAQTFWDELGITEKTDWLTICFFGNLNTERSEIDHCTCAHALSILRKRNVKARVVYCGAGNVAEKIAQEFAHIPEQVLTPGYMDSAQIYVLMRRSNLGLLPYLPTMDFALSLPNKSIEYLSGGLPVLTSLTKGLLFNIFSTEGCIVTYSNGDPERLADILENLAKDKKQLNEMSINAVNLFEKEFRAEKVYNELADLLETIVLEYTHAWGPGPGRAHFVHRSPGL